MQELKNLLTLNSRFDKIYMINLDIRVNLIYLEYGRLALVAKQRKETYPYQTHTFSVVFNWYVLA